MNRYFLASHSPHYSHQSKDLAHLSPERKKYLVMDVVYKMHPNDLLWCLQHPHELLIDIGPGFADHRWKFSVEELLELYPPDQSVADRINLAQSPLWLFWPHGKQLFVRTAEELARQPPGYGPTPEGPWPAGFVFPSAWPWKEATKGPFAPPPASYLEQYAYFALAGDLAVFAPGGDHAVFAPQPLFYNDRTLCAGVIFFLEVPSKDHELLRKGTIIKVPSYAKLIKHAPTGWLFVDQPTVRDYAQRYESGDLTGIQWTAFPPEDTAPTLEPEAARRSGPGAPLSAEWRSWSFEDLRAMLRDGWQKAQKKHPDKKRPSFDDVAECAGYPRKNFYDALKKYEHTWETIQPFIRD